MNPTFTVEGDVVIVETGISTGVDKDNDGAKSVEVEGTLKIKFDGSEIVDELVKSSEFVAKIKDKLGIK